MNTLLLEKSLAKSLHNINDNENNHSEYFQMKNKCGFQKVLLLTSPATQFIFLPLK